MNFKIDEGKMRMLMFRQNLSQSKLADVCKVSRISINKMLNNKPVGWKIVCAVSYYLGLTEEEQKALFIPQKS